MTPPIPLSPDSLSLADWLEIRALLAADKNASFSDLRRGLAPTGIAEGGGIDEETLAEDAFSELEDRLRACSGGYPFILKNSVLQAKEDLAPYWAYLFCLYLSYHGANRSQTEKASTELFEELATIAAKYYVSGEALRFGFPRRTLPVNFTQAVRTVCEMMGEGGGPRRRFSAQSAKDAQLDIIAWRPFPDRRRAQLILFGQCATGKNWEEKLSELQPRTFIDLYLQDALIVDPVRGFFTPFRLRQLDWDEKAKQGGILFDRCRISHFAYGQASPPELLEWNEKTQQAIRNAEDQDRKKSRAPSVKACPRRA